MNDTRRHIEDLIAEAVELRLRDRLDEIHDALRASRRQETAPPSRDEGIKGLDPNALYSVSFVAQRWDVHPQWVRDLDDETLPRAAWPGCEIRFRGADVLKAEGILVDAISIHRIGADEGLARHRKGSSGKRPYAKNLPKI